MYTFLKAFLALLVAFGVAPHRGADVTFTGSTNDCFADSLIRLSNISVFVFDARASSAVLDTLRSMDSLNFQDNPETAMTRMDHRLEWLLKLAATPAAIARTTTDSIGEFRFSVAPIDSLVVFAWYEAEDEPFPYGYTVADGRHGGKISVDMSRGGCDYIQRLTE